MGIVTSLKPVDWACAFGGAVAGKAIAGNNEIPANYALMASGAYLGLVASRTLFQTRGSGRARQFLLNTSCLTISYLAAKKSFSLLSGYSTHMAYAGGLTTLLTSLFLSNCVHKKALAALYREKAEGFFPVLVKNWFVNDKEIRVLIIGKDLEFEVIDNGSSTMHPLGTDGRGLETQVEYLAGCEALEEENGSYSFVRPEFTKLRSEGDFTFGLVGTDKHHSIGILKGIGSRVWQVYYESDTEGSPKRGIQVPISCILLDRLRFMTESRRCCYAMPGDRTFIDKAEEAHLNEYIRIFKRTREKAISQEENLNDCLELLENFQFKFSNSIQNLNNSSEKIFTEGITKNHWIQVAEKTQASLSKRSPYFLMFSTKINPSMFLNHDKFFPGRHGDKFNIIYHTHLVLPKTWRVTLICASGSTVSDPGNHAEIIIEGIERNKYFVNMAHLYRPRDPSEGSYKVRLVENLDPSQIK